MPLDLSFLPSAPLLYRIWSLTKALGKNSRGEPVGKARGSGLSGGSLCGTCPQGTGLSYRVWLCERAEDGPVAGMGNPGPDPNADATAHESVTEALSQRVGEKMEFLMRNK